MSRISMRLPNATSKKSLLYERNKFKNAKITVLISANNYFAIKAE